MAASHEATLRHLGFQPRRMPSEQGLARHVVVVGHGMVGHRFVEACAPATPRRRGESPCSQRRPTPHTTGSDSPAHRALGRGLLALPGNDYAGDELVELRLRDPGNRMTATRGRGDRRRRTRRTMTRWCWPPARTRSSPRCPGTTCRPATSTGPSPTSTRSGRRRTRPARGNPVGVVLGGGLLGLEAAHALRSFGLQPHVVEFAPRLMPRQVDEAGGPCCSRMISDLGVDRAHRVSAPNRRIDRPATRRPDEAVRVTLTDGTDIDTDAGGLRRRRAAARRTRPRLRPGARRARRCAHRSVLRAPGTRSIYAIGEWPRSTAGLRPGRSRLRDGRGGGRPAPRRRRGVPRRRHVDQAQAARRRRRQLRRRAWRHAGLPRGGGQRRRQPDLRQAGPLRRRKTLLGGILVGDASAYGVLRPMVGERAAR